MSTRTLILQVCFAASILAILYLVFRVLRIGTNPLSKWYFWISWMLVTPLLYFLVIFLYLSSFSIEERIEFNKEKWSSNKEVRSLMIDDLLERKILNHKSKDEIIDLLGIPEEGNTYFSDTEPELIYYLGTESGITAVDSKWLLIWFENDSVSGYQVKTD